MKKLLVLACVVGMSAPAFCASDVQKLDQRIDESRTVIQEIMATPDKAIPNGITRKAICVGVIPGVKKGALIIGGQYGQGVVTCHTGHGWSGPVFIRLAGGSIGLQAMETESQKERGSYEEPACFCLCCRHERASVLRQRCQKAGFTDR